MTNLNLNYKHQSGMATMLMSVIMVMTISLVSIYGAQVSVVEQKISSNHYRAKQAFEAAQAGMEASIFALTPSILNSLVAPPGGATPTGTENDLPIDATQVAAYTVASGNGHYRINFVRNPGDANRADFTAYGFSGDNASVNITDADQVTQQSVELIPIVNKDKPPANLIGLGSINLGSNVSVTNTTGSKLAATWSGGTTTSNATIDVSAGGGTGIYQGDGDLLSLKQNADQASIDAGLKYISQNNQFFENSFDESKARLKARSTVIDCQSSNCGTTQLKNQLNFSGSTLLNHIIWVDAYDESTDTVRTLNLDKSFSLGTPDNPVILIVEGKLKLSNAGATVNGIVYTTHDFINGTGKGTITGSLISEGNIDASGNMNFVYDDTTTMTRVMDSAGTTRYMRVAGTWKDFN